MKLAFACSLMFVFATLSSCGGYVPSKDSVAKETEEIRQQSNSAEEEIAPAISSKIEFDERDPLACQEDGALFSEHVFTRGGRGQNRQATVTVCEEQLKIHIFFETESDTAGVGLRFPDCEEAGWKWDVSHSQAADAAEEWLEFRQKYSIVLKQFRIECSQLGDELGLGPEWVKPAFDHVVSTLTAERGINAELY